MALISKNKMVLLLGTISISSNEESLYFSWERRNNLIHPGYWNHFPRPLLKASSSSNMLKTFGTTFMNISHMENFLALQNFRKKSMAFLKVIVLPLDFTLPWKPSGGNWITIVLLLPILVRPRNTTSRNFLLDSWMDYMNSFLLCVLKSCLCIPFQWSIKFFLLWFNKNVHSVLFLFPLLSPIASPMVLTPFAKVKVCLVRRIPTKMLPTKSVLW